MKKVFLVLALVATVLVSCNKVTTTVDSTVVAVDSVQVDSTVVNDDEARDYLRDYLKDTIK